MKRIRQDIKDSLPVRAGKLSFHTTKDADKTIRIFYTIRKENGKDKEK